MADSSEIVVFDGVIWRFRLCGYLIVVGLFLVGKFDVHTVNLVGVKTNKK
jgi:hypothetical protein